MNRIIALPLALLLALAACKEEDEASRLPPPLELTEEAAGHYCQMIILEHEGPKAQVHVAGYPQPFWFSQVRDGLAFLKSPEQLGEILGLRSSGQRPAQPGEGEEGEGEGPPHGPASRCACHEARRSRAVSFHAPTGARSMKASRSAMAASFSPSAQRTAARLK